ncbi:MAG: sodium-translocating pyrophosphatase [Candidatus Aenigmarchaeota archaeon]|nr:sodium-translocating pyrophosphatase [Candidatus Aenigmarchaeota archaeon]
MILEFVIISAFLALGYAALNAILVLRKPAGNEKMQEIARAIQDGAKAYLNRQYKTVAIFVVVFAAIFYFIFGCITSLAFVIGAILSAIAGYVGMHISVRANVRTAEAARGGIKPALRLAFRGGSVTGFAVVGLGLLGSALLYIAYGDPKIIIGYTFGASLISLFARVGGGIYTKGADVGADLVGKIEKGIPEDDPRNPAVIADNVGDNVGDCAGMAADLFESYIVTLIAAMLLGLGLGIGGVLFPLAMGGVAIIASIIGSLFVSTSNEKKIWSVLNRSIIITAVLSAIGFYFVTNAMFGELKLFYAALAGLVTTVVIGISTEYYTGRDNKPTRMIAESAKTGAGTNIISGISVGMMSTVIPVLMICAAIFTSYFFGGVYGIAVAAMAMLSMTGIIVAVDSYGPITDNAGGIAEMSKMPDSVRKVTDPLDAVGNTTKAVTKGFAIGSAALAALSLFVAFAEETGLTAINILSTPVIIGLFIGGMITFIFSSLTMRAVGKAAYQIVEEVRRQWKSIPGLSKGKARPDYAKCVDISTRAAIHELIVPALIAVIAPLVVGFVLGPAALGGLLAGAIITGLLLAITMTTGGASWDNAKKYIELGNLGGKGSDVHKAAVVGDTVGDAFKDTSGPALNPLIKVLNTIAILFAGLIAAHALAIV